MNINFKSVLVAGAIAFASTTSAQALTLTWTLQDVTFDDGGTAVGSFGFDSVTNLYSDINIMTTTGTAFGGASYSATTGFSFPSITNAVDFVETGGADLTGQSNLFLVLTQAFNPDAVDTTFEIAGFASGASTGEYICTSSVCNVGPAERSIIGGSITSSVSAVPLPASLPLFLAALGGFGLMRRKRG